MSTVNQARRQDAQVRRALLAAFHPNAKVIGYLIVLAFAALTLIVGVANHGLFR